MAFSELKLNLLVNKIYRFLFIADFAQLGYDEDILGSGIYKVVQILNKDEMYEVGTDKLVDLYTTVNKTEDMFNVDAPTFVTGKYFKLQDMSNVYQYYYVPEALIVSHPDANVAEYSKLMLTFDLGAFADPNLLDTVVTSVNDVLASTYGIGAISSAAPEVIAANNAIQALQEPTAMVYRTVWLGTDEYDVIQANRDTVKVAITNYKTECTRLVEANAQLLNKITALESIIVSLQA